MFLAKTTSLCLDIAAHDYIFFKGALLPCPSLSSASYDTDRSLAAQRVPVVRAQDLDVPFSYDGSLATREREERRRPACGGFFLQRLLRDTHEKLVRGKRDSELVDFCFEGSPHKPP